MAWTGVKQLGHVACADKHQMASVCTTIKIRGNVVPPVFVFPHVRMHQKKVFVWKIAKQEAG